MGNNGLVFQSALPGRGATVWYASNHTTTGISIHAPRKESDRITSGFSLPCSAFQSTLPSRRATKEGRTVSLTFKFQSTLPGRGATADPSLEANTVEISIHAPRKGSEAKQHKRHA